MSNFQWQTDEEAEGVWHGSDKATASKATPRSRLRLWLLLVGSFILLLVAFGLAHRTLREQADQREGQIRAEVETSYALLREALINQDSELLQLVLSGSNVPWSARQLILFNEQQLLTHPFPGWALQQRSVTFEVDPDLTQVAANLTTYYTTPNVEEIVLQQTIFFRQGEKRWLYTHPRPEFFGELQRLDGTYVTLLYPERDAASATQLSTLLDIFIERYCLQLESCPAGMHIELTLSSDPRSISALYHPRLASLWTPLRDGVAELPTPSLIGVPANPQSSELLLGHYVMYVLAGINRHFVIQATLGQEPFHQALFRHQMVELGLPASLGEVSLANPEFYGSLESYPWMWSLATSNDTFEDRVWVLIAFLKEQAPQISYLEMQHRLTETSGYNDWITSVTGLERDQLERRWQEMIYANYQAALARDQRPSQGLQMVCATETGEQGLYRLDVINSRFTLLQPLAPTHEIGYSHHVLPNDAAYVLEGMVLSAGLSNYPFEWQTTFFTAAGQEVITTFDSTTFPGRLRYLSEASPDGRYLLMVYPSQDISDNIVALLDRENCAGEKCPLTQIRGQIRWSPDSRQSLVLSNFNRLHAGSPSGERGEQVARGYAPFWIDNESYGYLRAGELNSISGVLTRQEDVVIMRPAAEPEILTLDSVYALVNATGQTGETVGVEFAFTSPQGGEIFLLLSSKNKSVFFIVTLDANSGEADLLLTTKDVPYRVFFSPISPALTLTAYVPRRGNTLDIQIVYTFNLENGFTDSAPLFFQPAPNDEGKPILPDWSRDGEWVVFTDEQTLFFNNPFTQQSFLLPHDFERCWDPGWIE